MIFNRFLANKKNENKNYMKVFNKRINLER